MTQIPLTTDERREKYRQERDKRIRPDGNAQYQEPFGRFSNLLLDPYTTVEETYELEYGSATVELHTDAVKSGDRVLLIDDLIATGGTMMAGKKLLEKLGASVMEGAAIVDLPELGGSQKLRASGLPLFTLVDFSGH